MDTGEVHTSPVVISFVCCQDSAELKIGGLADV